MCFYILSWYNTREKLNWYIFNFDLANKHLIQFIATPEHTSINIIKHGRNVRWAAAARILKNPASARWCRRTQNQEALELDAEATRVRSREVRDSHEGKVKRKGGDFTGAGGGGGSNPVRRPWGTQVRSSPPPPLISHSLRLERSWWFLPQA